MNICRRSPTPIRSARRSRTSRTKLCFFVDDIEVDLHRGSVVAVSWGGLCPGPAAGGHSTRIQLLPEADAAFVGARGNDRRSGERQRAAMANRLRRAVATAASARRAAAEHGADVAPLKEVHRSRSMRRGCRAPAAALDCTHHLQLVEAHMAAVGLLAKMRSDDENGPCSSFEAQRRYRNSARSTLRSKTISTRNVTSSPARSTNRDARPLAEWRGLVG